MSLYCGGIGHTLCVAGGASHQTGWKKLLDVEAVALLDWRIVFKIAQRRGRRGVRCLPALCTPTGMVAESNARNVPPALAWHQTSGGEGPRRAEEQRLSPRRTWDNMNTFIDSSVTSHDTPDRITQRNHMTHTAPYSRTTLRRKHAGNSSGGVPCDTPPAFSRRTGLGKRSPRENKPWYFFCATILNFPLFHSPAIYCSLSLSATYT